MHADLQRSMQEYDQTNPDSKLRAGEPRESLLMPLVGRSHELYAERRKRMVKGNPKALSANVHFRRVNSDTPDHLRGPSQQRDEFKGECYVRKKEKVSKFKAAREKGHVPVDKQDAPAKDDDPGA
jgi:hypothetical protein